MRLRQLVIGLAAALSGEIALAQNPADFARDILGAGETQRKVQELVTNLGLNCGDQSNWEYAMRELERIIQGIGTVMSEAALQLALKKDYPTLCHVMTQEQLKSYSEGSDVSHSSKCLADDGFGGCLLKQNTTTESPHPSYYWPKYFVEVNEKGNDSHPAFAKNNALYKVDRQVARAVGGAVDVEGALKLTSLVLGGKHMLGAIGVDVGAVNASELANVGPLTPFEAMRIRAGHAKTQPTFEVNLWPVALSEVIAAHFSVCGPPRVDAGQSPGGYSWPAKGVPMTCPVAMSRDAMHFWDTGMLDYLDPQAVGQMGTASNPVSCGAAAAMDALGGMVGGERDGLGDKSSIGSATGGMSAPLRQGLLGCSFPILGPAEGLMSKATSLADPMKWAGPYCTIWGSLAPRMSTAVYENDYSYANAGLKFKTMAHELFGVPRGEQERWSLAYPWEGPGAGAADPERAAAFSSFQSALGSALSAAGMSAVPGTAASRSEGLFRAGDPVLVDSGFGAKLAADQASNHAAEFAYLASLGAASAAAREAAIRQFRARNGQGHPGEAAVSVSAAAAPWVAAEVARAKKGELEGANLIAGDRRIYTIWEKIQCTSESHRLTVDQGGVQTKKYEDCRAAVRFELYKFVQLEILRKACDWMKQPVGKPWR